MYHEQDYNSIMAGAAPSITAPSGSGHASHRSSHSQMSQSASNLSLPSHRHNSMVFTRHYPSSRSCHNLMAGLAPSVSNSVTSSPWKDNVDDDMLTTVEESPYAAIDPQHLEDFEFDGIAGDRRYRDESKTPSDRISPIKLTRSMSEG